MKKSIKLTTLCLAMIILLSACAKTPEEKQPVNKTISSEQAVTPSSEEVVKPSSEKTKTSSVAEKAKDEERVSSTTKADKINFDEICQSVTLNGKKVAIPSKYSDLGDEYYFFDKIDIKYDKEKSDPCRYMYVIKSKSLPDEDKGNLMIILLGNCVAGKKERETKNIVGFTSSDNYKIKLEVKGIHIGSTREDVISAFGQPMKIIQEDSSIVEGFLYQGKKNQELMLNVKSGIVSMISISVEE